MTNPVSVSFAETDPDAIARATGRVAVFIGPDGRMDAAARRVNRLTRGVLARMVESGALKDRKTGDLITLAWPAGLAAEALDVVILSRTASVEENRRAGVALGRAKADKPLLLLAASLRRPVEVVLGLVLRAYDFAAHRTAAAKEAGALTVMVANPTELETAAAPALAVAEGVFFTRDLVSEPANHLTTIEFATRIAALADLGLKITILEEKDMEKLGMGALLSVGQGSASPSKLAVMEWQGGRKGEAPLALVGKGVVFDTGGISMKPAAGMEDMTMDMGGAGVVAGVMRTLARRKARANVVGLVGLVENMVSDRATRPGDVVRSMKGDTIEVINTDAEGRLVLADVLWYAQEKYKPRGMIDLATLTGAIIIGLGNENAGVFSNDDPLCKAFLKAAEAEGEGAWRMPLGQAYDDKLKSTIADMKNVGGREAGSITAAQFLKRFVRADMPWVHLDIAGVASVKAETPYAPKGASGWGVMALNRLIADVFEQG
ncbi:leucyl aminopeptidase [Roseovarius azorensis]|uniref:Probable cytosol aminopeptidase n=1 Tax=Roseovarius azorensis TaxID=1287727 RepID=A0A1H7GXI2_9RHOB|nr:leucyl aminopeptidase [Roseovarius azorensis]SEK41360.1 leucyl aminopeptidase [Roseovarius azorensis]